MVGRQIVDRAKIQRIIFEFDYYEKAFHQFYDTYRSLPGNLDIKNCNKYAIFRNHPNYGNICGTSYDGGYGMGVRGYVNARVMKGEISHRSYNNVINALEFAGLIERTYRDPNDAGIVSSKARFASWDGIAAVPSNERINPYWIRYLYATSTFDPESFFYFHATHLRNTTLTMDGRKQMTFAGSSTIANRSLPHEFDNERFRQLMDEKNVLALLKEPYTAAKRSGSMAGDSNVTPIRGVTGVLNAKLASELDAKLDDGRPGSGMILAMKSGSAHLADSTEKDHLENCYDKMANEVDKAIYNSSTDQKYGCNLIKILSDVKYFLQIKIGVFRVVYMVAQLHNINVKLRAYNSNLLDKATVSFVNSVKNVGGVVCGPIPMPKKVERFTVNRSPHVNKKSMEKFVKTTYTRLVRILGVTPALIDELSKVEILSGVGVEISITN